MRERWFDITDATATGAPLSVRVVLWPDKSAFIRADRLHRWMGSASDAKEKVGWFETRGDDSGRPMRELGDMVFYDRPNVSLDEVARECFHAGLSAMLAWQPMVEGVCREDIAHSATEFVERGAIVCGQLAAAVWEWINSE